MFFHPLCTSYETKKEIFVQQGLWFVDDTSECQLAPGGACAAAVVAAAAVSAASCGKACCCTGCGPNVITYPIPAPTTVHLQPASRATGLPAT
jgi:hypothetical protein